ncbi:hypothetical protein NP233_g9456 [Leucocoprinus birnbaumii]|uniref:Uncharacterized protein n=1 Tax=Leucocoprinus birnbaumii TaxID=56174 RepID=A0AAD5VKE3_9AGAR|nr:hypothetical protein NP233_g9456 [Leucocoprinus birnbaumii]
MSTSMTILHCLTAILATVVTGLATVNFGILSIWINGSAGVLTLLYHITILFLNWRSTRAQPTVRRGVTFKKLILSDVKLPTHPSPTYTPPPYEAGKTLSPNRRPTTLPAIVTIPKLEEVNKDGIPRGPFYTIASLFATIVLLIITAVGLFMTVQLTFNGAKFLLPAERASGMTFPWNIKVQKAQCTFLGVQTALALVVMVMCIRGRSVISSHENAKREEVEYGFASPDSTHPPATLWRNDSNV